MPLRKVVVGIIYNEDMKFLLMHRIWVWKGWEFPKGGIEKDELEEQALKREIKEETGLERIRIIEKIPYVIKYNYPKKYAKNYKYTGTVQSVFLVKSFDLDVKLPTDGVKEHDSFVWLPYSDARKKLTHTNNKKALDAAMKYLEEKNKLN